MTTLFTTGIMAILPMALAAGISAATSLFGGIAGARNAKKQQQAMNQALEKQRAEEQAWYDKEYNADTFQRADAQRAINMVSERLMQRNRAVQGQAAVGGLTDEAVAQQKAVDSQALADTVGNIAAAGEARKDAVSQQHHENVQAMNQQESAGNLAQLAAKQQAITTAVQSAGQVAAGIAGSQTPEATTATAPTATPVITPTPSLQQTSAQAYFGTAANPLAKPNLAPAPGTNPIVTNPLPKLDKKTIIP